MRSRANETGTARLNAPPARRRPERRLPVLLLGTLLGLGAGVPAAAGPADPFAFDSVIPERFQYVETYARYDSSPPSISFRRNEQRAVEAPTRYRTSSILKYKTPLGDTGMELRLKLPLKPRKIFKLELRF